MDTTDCDLRQTYYRSFSYLPSDDVNFLVFREIEVMSQDKKLKYEFDDFSLDVEAETLYRGGVALPLTRKAWQVLLILVQNANQTVGKEEIYTRLWSDSFVEEANLTQYIYLLRKSLSENSRGQSSYIETVPRHGYRFNGRVLEVSADEYDEHQATEKNDFPPLAKTDGDLNIFENQNRQNSVDENEFDETAESPDEDFEPPSMRIPGFDNINSPTLKSISYRHWFGGAAIVLAIIAAVFFSRFYIFAPTKTDDVKSLAILPFTVVGAENADGKLGLGMADAVITRLSKLQIIPVRPTSAVFHYTDRPARDSAVAGRELGVDSVLEGTVQHNQKNVRVSVRLINVADGSTLWAESFSEKFSDIFSVQDLISAQIAQILSIKLTTQQKQTLVSRETSSGEAFQAYQLGNYFWNRRGREDLQKAVEYFQKATRIDPHYARAYALLADSYAMLGYYRFAPVGEMNEKATANAENALELNSELAEPYIALAVVEILKRNFPKAREKIERAVALAPYNSSARHRYAVILLLSRKQDEGVVQMRLAQEYDSLSPTINKALCNALISQRKFSEAVGFCEKAVEISPATPGARASLAYAYFLDQRYDEAFEQINLEMLNEKAKTASRAALAYYYAETGRRAEAEKIYAELKTESPKAPFLAINLTVIGYALEKKKEALEYYKKMLQLIDCDPELRIFFEYDQMWDEIKRDPDFDKVYRQAGL